MRYVPYDQLGDTPNIIVDGYGTISTVLTLSHWPGSATPDELKDDLSTQIAFRYLDAQNPVEAEAVSNNHFDEDGLCGIYALLHPDEAQIRRRRLIDVASAGDFGTFGERASARIAFALTAYADEDRSPIADALIGQPYQRQTEALYEHLLGILPEMLDRPDRFRDLWAEDDAQLDAAERALRTGSITIEEHPEVDLAVVWVDGSAPWPHEAAINNATARKRILTMRDRRFTLRYRYESWVVYTSEQVAPRIDLQPLAEQLTATDDEEWRAGSVDDITPSLRRTGDSSMTASTFRTIVERYLAANT